MCHIHMSLLTLYHMFNIRFLTLYIVVYIILRHCIHKSSDTTPCCITGKKAVCTATRSHKNYALTIFKVKMNATFTLMYTPFSTEKLVHALCCITDIGKEEQCRHESNHLDIATVFHEWQWMESYGTSVVLPNLGFVLVYDERGNLFPNSLFQLRPS